MTAQHVSGGASSRGAEAAPTGAPPGSFLPVADRPPEVGDVLDGRYRLVDLLGRGGFGDVWRADELLPDGTPFRQVALKLLAPHVTDAASWVEEAKLLASFRHPSLVTIFATGVFHGAWPQPFVAMELLEGATLADVLTERGPIPWRRVLAWAREAAAALDVIHARGVVHLDLKPANLFLCKDGTIKVLDFGIARRATPPAGKGHVEAGAGEAPGTASARGRGRGTAGRFETGEAPDSFALPRSSVPVLSQRDAEMSTAVFAAEQGLGVGAQATIGEAAAPAAATSAQSTPEAFAPTFAMGTADVYGATRAAEGTTARAIIGTPGFMAPEIFEQSEPSAATDAYALAVCVAVLATGRLPLDVPDEPEGGWSNATAVTAWWAAIRTATLRGDMRDLRRGGAGLPAGLVRVLRRLFAVDAAARGVVPGKLCALLDEVWERPHGVPDPAFPGAEPMGPEHEGWLFGRDEEITRLGRDLEHEPCVVLVGPGAAGKTSLALAGLVPHLGKRAADGKDDWVAVVLRDPARGDAALDEALGRVSRALAGAPVEVIVARCAEASVGLALVVDPLEDAAAASVETRARLGELLSLAGDGHARPGLRVIGVLSEDEAAVVQGAAFGPALRSSMRYVGPPSPQAASAVVARPLRLLRAETAGLEPVIAEVQREIAAPGRLPFVAQALADFWAARDRGEGGQGRPALRGERWKELTGVVGAVARAADRVLDQMSGADRALAEEVLLLFTTTDGAIVKWSEGELLEAFGEEREAADRVLAELVSAGVVRAQAASMGGGARDPREGSLELLHEGLLTGWRRMEKIRGSHLVRLAFVERLREAAHAWDKSGKSGEMLLRGALLADVIGNPEWMAHGLVGRERDLVAASLRGERRRRAARGGAIAAGVLAIAGLVLGKRAIDAQQARADAEREAAKHEAYVAELVARSRRTDDPFVRVTLIAEAMKEGSTDGLLPIELADNVANVPRARFLTTDPVVAPSFEWEDRWVLAGATSSSLLIADLRPPEPAVIEDLDLDVDPEKVKLKTFPVPRVHALRPFEEPIAERVTFAFDTAFAARSTHGEVKVYRLTEEGDIALAAVAPMKCTGAMRTAARAPVLACATEDGLAAWDLRGPPGSAVTTHPWKGSVADVSPDGSVVAGAADKTLFLWPVKGGRTMEITLTGPVLLARMSPRDRVVAAVTTTAVEVLDIDEPREALARVEHRVQVAGARWDAGGLDLGLCGRDGGYAWAYLRTGARPADEPAPAGSPCFPAPGKRVPTRVLRADDLAEYANLMLGARPALDAFKLPDGRLLTRELVLFDQPKRVARSLLWFDGKGPSGEDELPVPGAAVVNVVRDGESVAWQVGGEVQLFDVATGKRRFSRPGNLLRRCEDGRLAAWVKADGAYRVIDARTGAAIGEVPRAPLFVLGVDERCSALFTQALDGTISANALGVSEPPVKLAVADGYVYDVRLSQARDVRQALPGGGSPGLYLLVSSGAIARLDEATRSVRVLAYATPRATAVADGFAPGEVIFADGTGVLRLRPGGAIDHVSETDPELTVTDVAAAPDGVTVQFLAGGKLHVIDVARGERRAMNVKNHERMLRWDDEGSLLLWSNDRAGGASGPIVPRAKALALKVAAAASNLTVDRERGVVLKR